METELRAFLLWLFVFVMLLGSLALIFCAGLGPLFGGSSACSQLLSVVRSVRHAVGLL